MPHRTCGIAYTDALSTGATLSVTRKACAAGYYSFGHEIGHNFGCYHNPETSTNPWYEAFVLLKMVQSINTTQRFPHGHGHLIAAGSADTGVRSILAYSTEGHRMRVNYYSNPGVIYPGTGTPTGLTGVSNNAAVITANR